MTFVDNYSNNLHSSLMTLEENGFCEDSRNIFRREINHIISAVIYLEDNRGMYFATVNKFSKRKEFSIQLGNERLGFLLSFLDLIIDVSKFMYSCVSLIGISFDLPYMNENECAFEFLREYSDECFCLRFFEENGKRCFLKNYWKFYGRLVEGTEKILFQI